jgi:N-acetylglutamate synthase-like GNAT family acetyltransferase
MSSRAAYEILGEDGFVISDDRHRLDLDRAFAWISGESYWAQGIPAETFARSVAHSLAAGAYGPDGAMVGFARVVTDRATFAWLCDVWVDEDSPGRGLGKRLIAYLSGHPDLQGLRRWMLATKDAHGLYEGFGFVTADATRDMEKLDRDLYRRAPTPQS